MEQNGRKPFIFEVTEDTGEKHRFETHCCAFIAEMEEGGVRLLGINAKTFDVLALYRNVIEIKKMIETQVPKIKFLYSLAEPGVFEDAD